MGGNKGRKLEFLMAEAQHMGATTVVTCGAAQSNFVRQLGAACAMLGMKCVAAVMDLPYADSGSGSPAPLAGRGLGGGARGGNLLLDHLLGVELHRFPDADWEILNGHAEALALRAEAHGERVYRIPIGGSSPLGAYGFVVAAREVAASEFDFIVTPCSSGSTHAGLAHAFHGSSTRVIGVACDPEPEIMEDLIRLVNGLDELTGLAHGLTEADFDFRLEWAGEAYGIPSPEGEAALERLARTEGIFLDPIYSAKAFAGLLALAESKQIGGKVVFWHTGGTPALFAE